MIRINCKMLQGGCRRQPLPKGIIIHGVIEISGEPSLQKFKSQHCLKWGTAIIQTQTIHSYRCEHRCTTCEDIKRGKVQIMPLLIPNINVDDMKPRCTQRAEGVKSLIHARMTTGDKK
jgi:hypothetical protein